MSGTELPTAADDKTKKPSRDAEPKKDRSAEHLRALWENKMERASAPIDVKVFLDGDYISAFRQKNGDLFRSAERVKMIQKRYGEEIANLSVLRRLDSMTKEDRQMICAGYLNWEADFIRKRMITTNDPVPAGKFTIKIGNLPENNAYFAVKPGAPGRQATPCSYDTATNTLSLDTRFRMPPILWFGSFIHELRHAYSDIETFSDNPPIADFNNPVAKIYELEGILHQIISWRMVEPEFMDDWRKVSSEPEYADSKFFVENFFGQTDPLFDRYVSGDKSAFDSYLKSYFGGR